MRPLQYRDVTKEQLVNRIDDLATIIEAKEKQIEALVTAAHKVLDAHAYERDSIGCPIDPACDCDACVGLRAAIKGATR